MSPPPSPSALNALRLLVLGERVVNLLSIADLRRYEPVQLQRATDLGAGSGHEEPHSPAARLVRQPFHDIGARRIEERHGRKIDDQRLVLSGMRSSTEPIDAAAPKKNAPVMR